jgi:hypothetical protein
MSDSVPQQGLSASPKKSKRKISAMSLAVYIVLLAVVLAFLWLYFTEAGQRALGNFGDNGIGGIIGGDGDVQAEKEAAAKLEENHVLVVSAPMLNGADSQEKKIASIDFGDCRQPSDEVLRQMSKLFRVSNVNLANVEITDSQLAYLGNLRQIVNLTLNGTSVTDAGIKHIAGLSAMQALYLNNTKITNAALDIVGKMENLTNLDLSYTKIDDQGMKKLAGLKHLDYLLLEGDNITDAGLTELAALPELKRLVLSKDMKISQTAVEKLKKASPNKLQVDQL